MIIREGPFTLEVTTAGDFFLPVVPLALSVPKGTLATYQITLTASGGYEGPVSIEVLDLPAGVAAAFGKNPLLPGESTSMTIPTSAIPKNTTRALRWRATEVV